MSRWDMFVSTLAAGFGWRFALRMALRPRKPTPEMKAARAEYERCIKEPRDAD